MKGLTRRQKEILRYIRKCIRQDGMPPTRAQITEAFGFASPNAAQCHIQALASKGFIEMRPGASRGIVPTRKAEPDKPGLPLVGRVAAGQPILASEHVEEYLPFNPDAFSPRPDYLLRVIGNSMIEAGIFDQDLLAVHSASEARSGQIVVARLDDEVTVKYFRIRNRRFFLEPANPDFKPVRLMPSDDPVIEGIGVGVIRRDLSSR